MNIKLLISQISVTTVYGALSSTVRAGNSLYKYLFLLLVNLPAAVTVNLVRVAAVKLEAYYLIEGKLF